MRADKIRADEIEARLAQILQPNAPTPAFRARLRRGLALAAHPRIVIERRRDQRLRVLIGAAAVGSAAGLIVIALRARMGNKATRAGARQSLD